MKLQGVPQDDGDHSARHSEPETHVLADSGTESGSDSDDCSVYEFNQSEKLQRSQGNQHITSHAPTTIVMNNVNSATITRGHVMIWPSMTLCIVKSLQILPQDVINPLCNQS